MNENETDYKKEWGAGFERENETNNLRRHGAGYNHKSFGGMCH